VASEFGEDARRPEMKKKAGAVNSCPPSWRAHRRRLDSRSESRRHGGKQSHAAQGRTAAVVGVHIGSTAVNMVRRSEFFIGRSLSTAGILV
jgi:hypothetical protein